MLDILLNRIRAIFLLIYIFTSIVLYYILDYYNHEAADKIIQENLMMASSIQKYVSEYQKPVIYKLIKEGKLSKEYFNPALMSSTYIVSHIQENFTEKKMEEANDMSEQLEYRFASDNPTNPNNQADSFELEVLQKFNNSDIHLFQAVVEHNGEKSLFYSFPFPKNTPKCLQCHGEPEDAPREMYNNYGEHGFYEKVGKIRAINAVYAPLDAAGSMWEFYLVVNIFSLLIYALIYFTLRYFFIQLTIKDELLAKQSRFAALGEMISMIAHQWRQPLTGMSMSINNLLLDIDIGDTDEKRSKETLELVNKQISYLSTTIDDFKNFFRPDNTSDTVDVKKLVEESCQIIDSSIKSQGVAVKIEIEEGIVLETRKNDVTQIVLNLVKNSMDAYKESKGESPSIEITAQEESQYVILSVKDYAGGIPKDIIDKIFDPYFSTKDKKNGTGLGLYMSKMIVEDHLEGELSVMTEEISTIFTIKLKKKLES